MSVPPHSVESDLRSTSGLAVGPAVSHHFTPSEASLFPHLARPELRLHHALADLEKLESAWRRLTPDCASPFQTFSWNLAWYRSYTDNSRRPFIFELLQDGVTKAILPCYLTGKTLRLAGDLTCDYQDVITTRMESVALLLPELLDWLNGEGRGFHFNFQKLSSEGHLFAALRESEQVAERAILYQKFYVPCPYVPLNGGLEGYLGSLPRKRRQDLRHSLNRLERDAPFVRVTTLRDYEIRVDDLENAASFHTEHFRKEGQSPFGDPRLLNLFGEIVKDPDVGFHLAFMTHFGDLLSVDFGFVRGDRYYGYLTAFDGNFASLAPGKCLILKRINEWVQEDGVETLDFLSGGESYKKGFTGDTAYAVWSMRLMPRDLKSRLRSLGLESDKRLRRAAKAVLQKTLKS